VDREKVDREKVSGLGKGVRNRLGNTAPSVPDAFDFRVVSLLVAFTLRLARPGYPSCAAAACAFSWS
jgi:hypothetical protein